MNSDRFWVAFGKASAICYMLFTFAVLITLSYQFVVGYREQETRTLLPPDTTSLKRSK